MPSEAVARVGVTTGQLCSSGVGWHLGSCWPPPPPLPDKSLCVTSGKVEGQVLIWAQVLCVTGGLVVTGEHVCPRLGLSQSCMCRSTLLPFVFVSMCGFVSAVCANVIPLHKLYAPHPHRAVNDDSGLKPKRSQARGF